MEDAFFSSGETLLRTLAIGVCAYACLVVLLRVSGKRTLSKMNAFDFVVTISIGSTLATILLNRNVSLAQGVLALALLIALQFVITWASVRLRWVRKLVTGEPTMLVYRGELLAEAMRRARVREDEVQAALRSRGFGSAAEAEAVVLETDGSFSVVKRGEGGRRAPTLRGLEPS